MTEENIMAVLFQKLSELEEENKQLRQKLTELANGPKIQSNPICLSNLQSTKQSENKSKQQRSLDKAVEALINYGKAIGV